MKTTKVTIRQDKCAVDELLRDQGLTQGTASQVQKEAAFSSTKEQAVVMLYLRNIKQTWHGAMVKISRTRVPLGTMSTPSHFKMRIISHMTGKHTIVTEVVLMGGQRRLL